MGMGGRVLPSSSYWWSSDSDDGDAMVRKKTRGTHVAKKMRGRHTSNQITTRFDHSPAKRDFVPYQKCIEAITLIELVPEKSLQFRSISPSNSEYDHTV